jgi:hypothetical protein
MWPRVTGTTGSLRPPPPANAVAPTLGGLVTAKAVPAASAGGGRQRSARWLCVAQYALPLAIAVAGVVGSAIAYTTNLGDSDRAARAAFQEAGREWSQFLASSLVSPMLLMCQMVTALDSLPMTRFSLAAWREQSASISAHHRFVQGEGRREEGGREVVVVVVGGGG